MRLHKKNSAGAHDLVQNPSSAGSTGKCKISDLFEELGLRI